MEDSSNKVGRPSKYEARFCEDLIGYMSEGYSVEACAGLIGVHKDTIYQWVKEYPDFSDAKKIGEAKSRAFWERLGIDHIVNKSDSESVGYGISTSSSRSLNASAWIFNMKNRFKWKDKHDESEEDSYKPIRIAYLPRSKRKPEVKE